MKMAYASNIFTETYSPIKHAIVHELAHATFNYNMRSEEITNALDEVLEMYSIFVNDPSKKGYGERADFNANEFWAEVTVKALLGDEDNYTSWLRETIKRYRL